TNNSQIFYENSIMSSNSSSAGVITRSDQFQIDFSCMYTQPEVGSESFRIKDGLDARWGLDANMVAIGDRTPAGQPIRHHLQVICDRTHPSNGFSGASSEIYLHCKLELCPTQGQSCTPSCGGAARRRRRSAKYADGNAALITMGWRN
ncbi:hypothetical protein KUCAC02_036565, partial [Chaenocephalus aceratus]